jgi:hypothetical protein
MDIVVRGGSLQLGCCRRSRGCGTGSGFFGQTQQSYATQVVGTATSGAVLQHVATVTLFVE